MCFMSDVYTSVNANLPFATVYHIQLPFVHTLSSCIPHSHALSHKYKVESLLSRYCIDMEHTSLPDSLMRFLMSLLVLTRALG